MWGFCQPGTSFQYESTTNPITLINDLVKTGFGIAYFLNKNWFEITTTVLARQGDGKKGYECKSNTIYILITTYDHEYKYSEDFL